MNIQVKFRILISFMPGICIPIQTAVHATSYDILRSVCLNTTRLEGPNADQGEGLFQYWTTNKWNPVCTMNWGTSIGGVVCRTLGYPVFIGYGAADSGLPDHTIKKFRNSCTCSGAESCLTGCPGYGWSEAPLTGSGGMPHSCYSSHDTPLQCWDGITSAEATSPEPYTGTGTSSTSAIASTTTSRPATAPSTTAGATTTASSLTTGRSTTTSSTTAGATTTASSATAGGTTTASSATAGGTTTASSATTSISATTSNTTTSRSATTSNTTTSRSATTSSTTTFIPVTTSVASSSTKTSTIPPTQTPSGTEKNTPSPQDDNGSVSMGVVIGSVAAAGFCALIAAIIFASVSCDRLRRKGTPIEWNKNNTTPPVPPEPPVDDYLKPSEFVKPEPDEDKDSIYHEIDENKVGRGADYEELNQYTALTTDDPYTSLHPALHEDRKAQKDTVTYIRLAEVSNTDSKS